ncbi:hypothetical protein CEP52_011912 [Fusarium oligoseptatum]|uniref:Heterokaryon incompatibility domain-containing protein n=1 Tax=Fusarium oligoseptatum TaxID=2604345 RepID=A0A428T1F5_9HYPO|nr:hypothetical protein CEP52_011912 [Fusarium oligoseptatum]
MDSSDGYQSSESGSIFVFRRTWYDSSSENEDFIDPGHGPLDESSSSEGNSKSSSEAHSDSSEAQPSSCCSVCGDLNLCNWDQRFMRTVDRITAWSVGSSSRKTGDVDIHNKDQMGLTRVTTVERLMQSSINCSKCCVILKGVSTHLNLEPDARLEFRSSPGGPLFVVHPLLVGSSEYHSSDSSHLDGYESDDDQTEDDGDSEGIHSHDEQDQGSESESEGESGQSQGSQEHSDDNDSDVLDSYFSQFGFSSDDEDLNETIEFYVQPGNALDSYHVQFTPRELHLTRFKGSPSPGTAVGTARTLPAGFTFKDAALVSEWLEDCEQNHKTCKKPTPNLPTRVLFIGSDVRLPHLYEGQNEEARYTALSHCWGGGEHHPPSTTRKTLAKHKEAIDWADLPQTFTDAMEVTRLLGIEYIWIDSLCIIQDDADDWVRESANMANIYQQAVLTISADGAADSYAGLFNTVSKRTAAEPKKIQWTDGSHEQDLYTRLTDLPPKSVRTHSIATVNIEENPLRGRAWALQEWLVSSRVVHFTKGELIWECKKVHRCECQVVAKECSSNWTIQTKSQFIGFHRKRNHTMVNWQGVVREFTNRLITKDTDRLPALSGIAALAKPNAADDYLAGIWKSNLPSSLVWTRLDEGSMRRQEYYAPTWSWASIIGPTIELYLDCSPIAEVVSLSKELASANPFGPLKSASITIKSPIARFPSHVRLEGEPRLVFRDASNTFLGRLTLDVTERLEITSIHEIVIALIGYHGQYRGQYITGLALKQGEEQESGFRRVGFVEIIVKPSKTWRRDVSYALRTRNKVITIM